MSEVSALAQVAESPPATLLDIHPDTLGYQAVQEPPSSGGRLVALGIVRDVLQETEHDHADRFDQFCDANVPLDLQASKNAYGDPDISWIAWLIRGTSNQELMDFLTWNVDSVREQQADDEFQETLEDERQIFKRGVAEGLQDGWLHPDFEVAITGVDKLNIYVGDGYNTYAKGREGYHTRGTKDVVIGGAKRLLTTGFDSLYTNTRQIAGHELTHPFASFFLRWMDEAATEHLNQTYKYGRPEIIRPSARGSNFSQTYYAGERDLAGAIFPGRLFTLAFSQTEDRDRFDELVDSFDREWASVVPVPEGKTAFDQLDLFRESVKRIYQQFGYSERKASWQAPAEVKRMLDWNPQAVFAVYENDEDVRRILQQYSVHQLFASLRGSLPGGSGLLRRWLLG